MTNNKKLMVPVEIHQDDLIDTLSSSIGHEDAPDFIKKLDLSYQDFEVTEKTIVKLLDSMRGEVIVRYGKDSEKVALWDSHAFAIKKILEDFD